jgi:hypothetical protein
MTNCWSVTANATKATNNIPSTILIHTGTLTVILPEALVRSLGSKTWPCWNNRDHHPHSDAIRGAQSRRKLSSARPASWDRTAGLHTVRASGLAGFKGPQPPRRKRRGYFLEEMCGLRRCGSGAKSRFRPDRKRPVCPRISPEFPSPNFLSPNFLGISVPNFQQPSRRWCRKCGCRRKRSDRSDEGTSADPFYEYLMGAASSGSGCRLMGYRFVQVE